LLDFCGSAAVLAWIPACCSSIMRSFLSSISVTSVTGGDINSGESLNSVGGVPVDVRTRIAGFLWLGCCFGLDSRLLLKHQEVLFSRPFGYESPPGWERQRRKLELCWRRPHRHTAPHYRIFVARLRFWLGFPPVAQASCGPFYPAFR
jgi:hypothetical protein